MARRWRDDIYTARLRLKRVSRRVSENYLGPAGVFGGRRRIVLLVGLAITFGAGAVVGHTAYEHASRQRLLMNIAQLRQAMTFVSGSAGGLVPRSTEPPLLDMLISRKFVKAEVVDSAHGYTVLAVTPVERAGDQYFITVKCDTDLDCFEVGLALRAVPTFIDKLSPPANPMRLAFHL
jgi:hypothetical protein